MIDVMKQALEALESNKRKHYYCEDRWYSCPKHEDGCANDSDGNECNCGADEVNAEIDSAITALRQAIQQYEKEQAEFNELVEQVRGLEKQACEIIRGAEKQAALDKMSENAQEIGLSYEVHTDHPMRHWDRTCPACAVEKQEPVAWWTGEIYCDHDDFMYHQSKQEWIELNSTKPNCFPIPLYATPPRKEWVGLDDEDWMNIPDFQKEGCELDAAIYDWIEARLKEKNT